MEKREGEKMDRPPTSDHAAPKRDAELEWNQRIRSPDENFATRKQVERADADIEQDIDENFAKLGVDSIDRPKVIIENGEVIISGEVSSDQDIQRLQQAVEKVPGVQRIYNDLRVVN